MSLAAMRKWPKSEGVCMTTRAGRAIKAAAAAGFAVAALATVTPQAVAVGGRPPTQVAGETEGTGQPFGSAGDLSERLQGPHHL
jgi:hypothetical protein